MDDQTKFRQVHRTLLKAVAGAAPQGGALPPCPPPLELSFDGDLFMLGPETPVAAPARTAVVTQTTPRLLLPPPDSAGSESSSAPSTAVADPPSVSLAVLSTSYAGESEVRRSARSTAGQHPNVYHLPRPVGNLASGAANPPGPVSNAVTALFRPWS